MTQNHFISFFALVLSLSPATLMVQPTHAASIDRPTFLLPANDGYGVADCLIRGDECAMQVANAWCAALGYDHASDMKTATDGSHASRIAVTCDP